MKPASFKNEKYWASSEHNQNIEQLKDLSFSAEFKNSALPIQKNVLLYWSRLAGIFFSMQSRDKIYPLIFFISVNRDVSSHLANPVECY